MEIIKYILMGLIFVSLLIILVFSILSKKPITIVLLNALLGVGAIIAINTTSKYSGCYIPVNLYSVAFSSVYGLPPVAGLLFIKFLFI